VRTMNQDTITLIVRGFMHIFMQVMFVLFMSPLIINLMKRVKAHFQRRIGPGLLQGYYDLWKLLRKDIVISEHASWIFRATPYVVFSATLVAAVMVPSFFSKSVTAINSGTGTSQIAGVFESIGVGDAILVIYLLALARFFTVMAGLDTGSAFGGMGSSREMMISSLAEPVSMTGLFVLATVAGSTNFGDIIEKSLSLGFVQPVYLLLFLAFMIVAVAETGRVPVDNPATHLELTMVHEAMILEYTGRHLALIEWAGSIKLMMLLTIIANVFIPWGISSTTALPAVVLGIFAIVIKVGLLATTIAIMESSIAKLRLFRIPELMGGAFALVMLALIIKTTGMG
jgi:formate hydrogenlyase subunit 4